MQRRTTTVLLILLPVLVSVAGCALMLDFDWPHWSGGSQGGATPRADLMACRVLFAAARQAITQTWHQGVAPACASEQVLDAVLFAEAIAVDGRLAWWQLPSFAVATAESPANFLAFPSRGWPLLASPQSFGVNPTKWK